LQLLRRESPSQGFRSKTSNNRRLSKNKRAFTKNGLNNFHELWKLENGPLVLTAKVLVCSKEV
jgi:hypothetical protein